MPLPTRTRVLVCTAPPRRVHGMKPAIVKVEAKVVKVEPSVTAPPRRARRRQGGA